MPVSLRLGERLEQRLAAAARRLRLNKSELIKRSLQVYLDQVEPGKTPFELGKDLFGTDTSRGGDVARRYKTLLRKKLRAKHRR